MFSNLLGMMGNYEDRMIGRYECGDVIVSTALVTDADYTYETAVAHHSYNDGEWVVVAGYDSKEDAGAGHAKWIKKMTSDRLPKSLCDRGGATIAKLCDEFAGKKWRRNPKKEV